MLTSIAQSSIPHAFLLVRIQNRSTVKMMSKGSGTMAARAIGYEVGAIVPNTEMGYRVKVDGSKVRCYEKCCCRRETEEVARGDQVDLRHSYIY